MSRREAFNSVTEPIGVVPADNGFADAVTPIPIGEAQPAGVAEATELALLMACAQGVHAWVPWLRLENGSHVTWCVRCRHTEQWDGP